MRLLAILDTETTGFLPKEGHLLEVGCVRWSVDHGCVVDSLSMLVRGATDNAAVDVNRIPVLAMASFGFHTASVTTAFARHLMPCDAILAHSAEFDKSWCDYHLESLPQKPWLCTKDDFEWDHGKPGSSLISLAVDHGVPVIAAHRALTDCNLIAGILSTYPPEALKVMLARAARPRILLQSKHKFDKNEEAKALGFRWESGSKRWLKRHAKEDPLPAASWPIVEVTT